MNNGHLSWRCRRGMKELDELLERYLVKRYQNADLPEQTAFAKLLELPDPTLYTYLLGGAAPDDPAARRVIEFIAGARA